jgi:hypothetical protein
MAPQRKFSQSGDRFPKWAGPQKRERPANFSDHQITIDVPALFFGAIMIVFVLWPAAQWALGL